MLTPLEIQNQEFRKSLRGYSEEEVDQFLEGLSRDYEALYKENRDLKETIDELEDKLRKYLDLEETLQKTLVLAQQTSDDIRNSAEKEAELIVREAKAQVEQMLKQTRDDAARYATEYEDMRIRAANLRIQLKSFFKSQLEMLTDQEAEAAATLEDWDGRAIADAGSLDG